MQFTEKAVSWRDELANEFTFRLSALVAVGVTKGFSAADGSPTLGVGSGSTGTAGTDGFFLKMGAIASINKDVLGLAQNVFGNHVCQVVWEQETAADIISRATLLNLLTTLALKGWRIELYNSNNGTAPAEASIIAANLKSTWEPHVQYPLIGSM